MDREEGPEEYGELKHQIMEKSLAPTRKEDATEKRKKTKSKPRQQGGHLLYSFSSRSKDSQQQRKTTKEILQGRKKQVLLSI